MAGVPTWILVVSVSLWAVPSLDTQDALQKAVMLVQQGRLDEAEQQAQLALPDPEARAAAYSVLGTIRLQQNRLQDSAALLQKAIEIEPRLVGAHLNLAQVYTIQGKPDLALGLFRRILELDGLNIAARLALARAETEKQNFRQSLDLAQPVLAQFKQSPDGLFVLATDFLKLGHRSDAAALAADWARLANLPPDWSIKFALLLLKEGIVAEATEILERAMSTGPPSYEVAFNLGGAYVLKRDWARALTAYDAALAVKPDAVEALRQAAGIAEQQGELERSLSYWIRARKLEPNDPGTLLGFGRVCLKMDLLDDAEPALNEAARLRPEDTVAQYTLAAAKVGKRQFEAAESLLQGLVTKRPDDAQLQYAVGSVFYVQGKLAEAAAHLRESLRLQPEQLASRYYLALVARDQGDERQAIEMLERLTRSHPDHAASCEALGGLLMNAQRYAEAEVNLRNAVRLNAKSVKANYQLGLLLARMGRKDEADKQLELAKTLRKEDEETSRLQLRLLDPDR